MPRRTPSNVSGAVEASIANRRSASLPTEPMNTIGRPSSLATRAVRSNGGQFARDVFLHLSSNTEYRTTAVPAVNSQQVFVNTDAVLASSQYPSAPCYFDPDDRSRLVLRPTFPAVDGDYVVIRYFTAAA